MSVRLAISMGDYNGIGPETILKSLSQIKAVRATPVIIGHKKIFSFYADRFDMALPDHRNISSADDIEDGIVNFLNMSDLETIQPEPGKLSEQAGKAAMLAVEKGIESCMQQHTQGLVTASISKEAVNKAGYHIPGHTEFLAEKTGTDDFMMILVHDELRVGLVTIHIPVAQVAGQINKKRVSKYIRIMNRTLSEDFNIPLPRTAVLGLNPHAGDGGIIGDEEITSITPAIKQAQSADIDVHGPFPADGFFGNRKYEEYDGVLAMYHDQGLGPFKTLSFGGGVNITAGLPIVRTSPDHGTAFDIAGENVADPSSFLKAAKLAIQLSKNRYAKT
ncbi:MAG TPA: 4-hydroxythreonine-4-phosphate dehydrogenase PdxA [Balneolaceae bacterium]|nr:4-hydroxythreonine-4-phosphate dehydrogenase PdxA [Balneolaceae bacterium]